MLYVFQPNYTLEESTLYMYFLWTHEINQLLLLLLSQIFLLSTYKLGTTLHSFKSSIKMSQNIAFYLISSYVTG